MRLIVSGVPTTKAEEEGKVTKLDKPSFCFPLNPRFPSHLLKILALGVSIQVKDHIWDGKDTFLKIAE